MAVPKVFVASSSEGLAVVDPVQRLLQRAVGKAAEVRPWPQAFQLTRTYIESLERLLDTSDFAVLVLTPDDRTMSRNRRRMSPRDNVVFETGLFFGRLGRDRCFLIQRSDLDLKLPTDLLGVEPATFRVPPDQDLESALEFACARIGTAVQDAISRLPSRPRLTDAQREAQATIRKFGDRIVGTWWERIRLKKELAISFFTVALDEVHSSVRLNGKAYSHDGAHRANWRSAGVRLEDRKILYVRECQRVDASTTAWLPGLGEVAFEDSGETIDQGVGKFWESDESNPDQTIIKLVDVQRNLGESHALTMLRASERERGALAAEKLASW